VTAEIADVLLSSVKCKIHQTADSYWHLRESVATDIDWATVCAWSTSQVEN